MTIRFLENRIPPPLVCFLSALASWGLAHSTPSFQLAFAGQRPAGALVICAGILIALAGIIAFRRARTTVSPLRPDRATALVTGGIYRWTRNPMYLGMATVLAGWTLILGHPAGLLGLTAFVLFIDRFQIQPEERALEAIFGDAFAKYRSAVGRWIQIPPGRVEP
ncbi:MAG: methyltransferase family protein [Caulobacterales bacterium]|uniref:methyltransferase family protein n=1 Tax=Glycocaulis sp. TaxID=1969725 RepID=UPI003FA0294A